MPTKTNLTIAVLADVHANWPALEAVLNDMRRHAVNEIWYLGDFIGYGPYPVKVIATLQKYASRLIVGNYDLNVLKFPQKRKKWKFNKDPSKIYSFGWTYRQLTSSDKKYLLSLPQNIMLEASGKKFLLVHGSPDSIDEPLKPNTPKERFSQIARQVKADVVLCGHTHVFFNKKIDAVQFINPGSVGRPFDKSARASYAIIRIGGAETSVKNYRVSYDVSKVLRKMKKEGFPEDICQSIKCGTSLDDIKDRLNKGSQESAVIKEVLKVARSCEYEKKHSHQVTKLALKLFDQLHDLHKLSVRERLLLQAASLLHDIGWVKGRVRHHKTSRDIILKSFNLPLTKEEKLIVALVARYHRRALPKCSHKYYSDLHPDQRIILKKLAAILRLADGLDRRHMNSVIDLACHLKNDTIMLDIDSDDFNEWEQNAAYSKGDLFEDVFHKKISINWKAK